MKDTHKSGKKGSVWLFAFDFLLLLLGLFLIGSNIYGVLVNKNSPGPALFGGIVITIYSLISIFRDNPSRHRNSEPSQTSSRENTDATP